MKSRSFLCGTFFLLILSLLAGNANSGIVSFENTQEIDTLTKNLSCTPSGPILIQSNGDFETQGWPGHGTEAEPYLIANLSISSMGDCITIERTSVHFVIRNCTLTSNGSAYGVRFSSVVNGAIEQCDIIWNSGGIDLSSCNNCSIINNTVADNASDGIELRSSNNCTLAYNEFRNCTWDGVAIISSTQCTINNNTFTDAGPVVYGFSIGLWMHSFANNTVNVKPLGYFANLSDSSIDGISYGQVILVNCLNVTLRNGIFENSSVGVQLAFSEECLLLDNIISGNAEGLHIIHSTGCNLTGNSVSNSYGRGIWQSSSPYCKIVDNSFSNNPDEAIHLTYSNGCRIAQNAILGGWVELWLCNFSVIEDNTISRVRIMESINCSVVNNTIQNCLQTGVYVNSVANCTLLNNTVLNNARDGIELILGYNCTVIANTVFNNSRSGLRFVGSDSSIIAQNNITENIEIGISLIGSQNTLVHSNTISWNRGGNARDDGSDNQWDDGVSAGNYWSDYGGHGEYAIPGDAGSMDRYPFSLGDAPFLDHPVDIRYDFGTRGNFITWNPSDSNPESYELFRNSTLLISETWTGSSITIDVDGLDVGLHNYTLIVSDDQGNWVADTVIVHVKATTNSTATTITTNTTTTTETDYGIDAATLAILGLGIIGVVVIGAVFTKKMAGR